MALEQVNSKESCNLFIRCVDCYFLVNNQILGSIEPHSLTSTLVQELTDITYSALCRPQGLKVIPV